MTQLPLSVKLIVGLGNPGPQYALTRHNIGFLYIDVLAGNFNATVGQSKFQGIVADVTIDGHSVKLLKPQTFMNLSGQSVQACAQFYKIQPQEILVVHDEADLLPFQVRMKQGGSPGGHNGLKSIDQHVGPNYWRLRLGVGRPSRGKLSSYVLAPFDKTEQALLPDFLSILTEKSPVLFSQGTAGFLNEATKELSLLK